MPIVQINMMEGRTEQQIELLIESVAQAVMDSIDSPEENIRVLINEIPKKNWGLGRITAHKAGR